MTKSFSLFILLAACASVHAQLGSAVRELPYDFHPGDLIEVRIQITPPVGTTNWSVHELYPDRWDFISSTNASSTDEFSGALFFGPFTDDMARTLSYQVLSNPGLTNSVNFVGQVSFNGTTNPVASTRFFPARNEWVFAGPQATSSQAGFSGLSYGAGRWAASSFGWVTTLEAGGRLTYPHGLRYHGGGLSRLAYVNGLFLLFGASPSGEIPRMTISDDGLSWKTAQSEPGDLHFDPFANGGMVRAVSYGNGAYVAVGDQWYSGEQQAGAIFRSTNGYNWRRIFRVGSPLRIVNAISFANGRFMAVADLGTLLTSTNGLDWTEIRPITGNDVWTNRNLLGISHGPEGWIIPTSASGIALRSQDGENWTELIGTSPGIGRYWQSFYADGKYWFSDYTLAYTTVDGTSWTSLQPLSTSHPVGPVSRASNGTNPQYLGAGINPGSLVSSTNGTDWIIVVPSGFTRWPRYLSVAVFNNEHVIGGQNSQSTGIDGREFPNDRGSAIWSPLLDSSVLSVRNGNGQWRKEVQNSSTAYADLLSTTEGLLAAGASRGVLWANVLGGINHVELASAVLPSASRAVPLQIYKLLGNPAQYTWEYVNASLTATTNGYDLFAETYSFIEARIHWGHFTSTNGSNWVSRAKGLNDPTNFPAIRGIAWGGGRFVAVSEGSSPGTSAILTSTNRIYTSTNGEDYKPVDLSTLTPGLNGEGLTGAAYANGRFVAIGNAGRILSSTNGFDWETTRNSDGHRWNRVRYLDGTWAAVGNAGWVAFSPDGQNWTSKTSGTESDLTDIAHMNGTYMMVGSHAMVLISLPVAAPVILAESAIKLSGLGLQFNVSGHVGKILDIQTSSNCINWNSLFLTTNTTGVITFADAEPNQGRRFYRAVQQP